MRLRLKNEKLFYVLAAIGIVLLAAVGVWLVLVLTAKKSSVDPVAEHDIHTFAERITSQKKYQELPAEEQQDFLKQESAKFGIDPRKEITPEIVTMRCIDFYSSKLYQEARRYKDEIHEYQTVLNHALTEVRDKCYENYDPEGKMLPEEMPHMQAH